MVLYLIKITKECFDWRSRTIRSVVHIANENLLHLKKIISPENVHKSIDKM